MYSASPRRLKWRPVNCRGYLGTTAGRIGGAFGADVTLTWASCLDFHSISSSMGKDRIAISSFDLVHLTVCYDSIVHLFDPILK